MSDNDLANRPPLRKRRASERPVSEPALNSNQPVKTGLVLPVNQSPSPLQEKFVEAEIEQAEIRTRPVALPQKASFSPSENNPVISEVNVARAENETGVEATYGREDFTEEEWELLKERRAKRLANQIPTGETPEGTTPSGETPEGTTPSVTERQSGPTEVNSDSDAFSSRNDESLNPQGFTEDFSQEGHSQVEAENSASGPATGSDSPTQNGGDEEFYDQTPPPLNLPSDENQNQPVPQEEANPTSNEGQGEPAQEPSQEQAQGQSFQLSTDSADQASENSKRVERVKGEWDFKKFLVNASSRPGSLFYGQYIEDIGIVNLETPEEEAVAQALADSALQTNAIIKGRLGQTSSLAADVLLEEQKNYLGVKKSKKGWLTDRLTSQTQRQEVKSEVTNKSIPEKTGLAPSSFNTATKTTTGGF